MKKIFYSVLLMLLGVGFTVWGGMIIANARATLDWPVMEGEIIFSSVAVQPPDMVHDKETMYSADIRYTYKVNGRNYTSSEISLGDYSSNWRFIMEDMVKAYPKGKRVAVYFNPDKPGQALLEPGPVFVTYIPFGFGVLCLFVGMFALIRRKGPPEYRPGQGRSGLTHGGKYSGG